ncbi:Transcriptional regulator MntR [Pseudovibrio axinellae]|uniref:Transcriptional regulator MntR n=1 Tax=Pseudovibrio axinellae TaxID=989403 RepID=A0A166BDD6_9HYPH|nr:manganese-binding transcriptional regulator MntR [Pseudovibrio axinellae]KZL22151.1 Transcriptional regulator MntR [Pseudovibrio axinellae]SEQ53278.1 iron (metal) dependent repressor, DtxR family [Pseudovibrio axinellae]
MTQKTPEISSSSLVSQASEGADSTAGSQAERFESVRRAHQSEMAEDYVELIAELIVEHGEARPVEIAERLGVSQPTVTKNLARLKRDGLVIHAPYRSVFLTDEGKALAEICRKRHRIVVNFLKALGIKESIAEHDAEGIEHHVSKETLAAFESFTQSPSKP